MKRRGVVPVAILAVLLAACLLAVFFTRDSGGVRVSRERGRQQDPVDGSLLDTARKMAALAETGDEKDQALQALHLADHELDLAFAAALREAAAYRVPSSGPLHDLAARVDQLKIQIAADERRIAQLSKKPDSDASEQLDLVKAKLALDQDDFEDAQQDLARQGGDPHAALQRALQQHDAAQQEAGQAVQNTARISTGTLSEQVRAWITLGDRSGQLAVAEGLASGQAGRLEARHNDLDKESNAASAIASNDTAARIASLRTRSEQRKTIAALDQRIQDSRQLAGVYGSWRSMVDTRRRGVLHLFLGSLAQILAIVLATLLVDFAIRRAFRQAERKRLHQLQLVVTVAVQVVAVGFILLVVFGPPSQISTIIGLTTAGLTVVLKDFIVAFFGWFTLMGKDGIRVGDWVEIEGVSGEVIEIGLLKTVLLESGNWTDTGHPTGRQVAFSNSFAMEGHYFNFSTSGQWMWDELQVTLPAAGDPYRMAEEIGKLVERETEADAAQAAQDWKRAATRYDTSGFSAKPAVNLRPSVNGLEVVVRYITRAPRRYAMKSRLFQVIVDLLHKPAGIEAAAVR